MTLEHLAGRLTLTLTHDGAAVTHCHSEFSRPPLAARLLTGAAPADAAARLAPLFAVCRRAHALAGREAHLIFVDNPPQHPGGDFCLDGETVRTAADAVGPTLTYAGTGVFAPAFFADVPDGAVMKLRPLLDAAISERRLTGEHHRGRWVDVGTPERLADLDRALRQTDTGASSP
jgi:hypothetical protein